jgi:hypothetical protein
LVERREADVRTLRLTLISLGLASILQACFSEGDESVPTVHLGDVIETAQGGIAADGTPAVMAQLAMWYDYPPDSSGLKSSSPTMRNYQTVLFSRRGGKWIAFPLRNIQTQNYSGALVADRLGNLHAVTRDMDRFRLYHLGDTGWTLGPSTAAIPVNQFPSHSQVRTGSSDFTLRGIDTLVAVWTRFDRELVQFHIANTPGGSVVMESGTSLSIYALHSAWGFNSAAGLASIKGAPPSLWYYRWQSDFQGLQGLIESSRLVEDTRDYGDVYFTRLDGRDFLASLTGDSARLYGLDSLGRIEDTLSRFIPKKLLVYPRAFGWMAMTGKGCLHGLETPADIVTDTLRILHANTCMPFAVDTLRIPNPSPAGQVAAHPYQMEIGPGDTPFLFIVLHEIDPDRSRGDNYVHSWLYVAELGKNGAWKLELVAAY